MKYEQCYLYALQKWNLFISLAMVLVLSNLLPPPSLLLATATAQPISVCFLPACASHSGGYYSAMTDSNRA